MSAHQRIRQDTPPPELEADIVPGRSLIRVADASALSASERLLTRLRRLSWRTPLHGMKLRGRYPLKLVAVPRDPVAGDRKAGDALMAGRLVYAGDEMKLSALDYGAPGCSQAFADHLQSFAWLRDLAASSTRDTGARIAEHGVAAWMAEHGTRVDETAWRPRLWGRRLLFWTAYAPYILSSRDIVYRSAVLNMLARGARHLESEASRASPGLPRVTAYCGLLAAGLLIQGGPGRVRKGEAGLVKALATAQHDDGGLASRSPDEQLQLVETLAMLRGCYFAAKTTVPAWLGNAASGAAPALAGAVLGDGRLSSWQGGNPGDAQRLAAVLAGCDDAARPLRQARGWGYQRLASLGSVVVFDAAPPPVSRALSGGCASTLAFEMSDGPHRLIVNCGGAGRRASPLPADLLGALRSTAAHSTLVLGDTNSTAILDDGALGHGVSEVALSRDELDEFSRVEASHGGYVRRFGLSHKRALALSSDGRELRGEDALLPEGRKRLRDAAPFAIRFHLGPRVEAILTADGLGALLRIAGGSAWQFRVRGAMLTIEESLWVDGDGTPAATQQLVVAGETPAGGAQVSWLLKRAG